MSPLTCVHCLNRFAALPESNPSDSGEAAKTSHHRHMFHSHVFKGNIRRYLYRYRSIRTHPVPSRVENTQVDRYRKKQKKTLNILCVYVVRVCVYVVRVCGCAQLTDDPGQGLDVEPLGSVGRHEDQGGSPIVQSAGVGRGYRAYKTNKTLVLKYTTPLLERIN